MRKISFLRGVKIVPPWWNDFYLTDLQDLKLKTKSFRVYFSFRF